MGPLREERVSVNPIEAVQVTDVSPIKLALLLATYAALLLHDQVILNTPSLHKGEVKSISVVRGNNCRLVLSDKPEESKQ